MTQESLEKANRISKRIEELKCFHNALNGPYMFYIRAVDFNGFGRCDKSMIVKKGTELHSLIIDYISRKLEELENEFEKL